MNIDKALEHFQWKFKNQWKPTTKDIEAFNSILEYKELVESKALNENESLAKLWIHQYIMFAQTKLYSSERCASEIDKILKRSVYDWCIDLQKQLKWLKFMIIGNDRYPIEDVPDNNHTKLKERDHKIANEFEEELKECMLLDIREDRVIKFVERNITRVLNEFEK